MQRPILNIPFSPFEIILEALSVLGVLFAVYLMASRWSRLPETVPTHFSSEEPDKWGPKRTLLLVPAIMVVFYVGLTLLGRRPDIFNYPVPITAENAARLYHISRTMEVLLKVEMIWLIAYAEWQTLQIALDPKRKFKMLLALLPVLLILFVEIPLWVYLESRAA